MRSTTLYKVLAALMILMSAPLVITHTTTPDTLDLPRSHLSGSNNQCSWVPGPSSS